MCDISREIPQVVAGLSPEQCLNIAISLRMRLARCLSPLSPKLSLVGRGYSWIGDHLGIGLC